MTEYDKLDHFRSEICMEKASYIKCFSSKMKINLVYDQISRKIGFYYRQREIAHQNMSNGLGTLPNFRFKSNVKSHRKTRGKK